MPKEIRPDNYRCVVTKIAMFPTTQLFIDDKLVGEVTTNEPMWVWFTGTELDPDVLISEVEAAIPNEAFDQAVQKNMLVKSEG
jgi:hypothetical protein